MAHFWGTKILAGQIPRRGVPPGAELHACNIVAAPGGSGVLTLFVRTEDINDETCLCALAVLRPGGGCDNVQIDSIFAKTFRCDSRSRRAMAARARCTCRGTSRRRRTTLATTKEYGGGEFGEDDEDDDDDEYMNGDDDDEDEYGDEDDEDDEAGLYPSMPNGDDDDDDEDDDDEPGADEEQAGA